VATTSAAPSVIPALHDVTRPADVTGVELGGALKNVLAIACGEML